MGGRIHGLLIMGEMKKKIKDDMLMRKKKQDQNSDCDETESIEVSSKNQHTSLGSRRSEYKQSSRKSERRSIKKGGLGDTPGEEDLPSFRYRKGIDDINAEAAKGTAKGDCEGCQLF